MKRHILKCFIEELHAPGPMAQEMRYGSGSLASCISICIAVWILILNRGLVNHKAGFGSRHLLVSKIQSGSILNNRDQDYLPKIGAIRIVLSVQNVKCYWCGYQKIVQIQSLAPSHLQNQDVCRESNSSNQAYKSTSFFDNQYQKQVVDHSIEWFSFGRWLDARAMVNHFSTPPWSLAFEASQ